MDLFLAEGFSQLTLDEVAAGLGCSKRTLYALAASKEQLAVLAVRHFFKRSTDQVESAIARTRTRPPGHPLPGGGRRGAAAGQPRVSRRRRQLPPGGGDPTGTNTCPPRVRELIDEGIRAGAFRQVSAAFVGEVVTATMRRITTGEIAAATGLNDAEAYAELARLVVAAVRRDRSSSVRGSDCDDCPTGSSVRSILPE